MVKYGLYILLVVLGFVFVANVLQTKKRNKTRKNRKFLDRKHEKP